MIDPRPHILVLHERAKDGTITRSTYYGGDRHNVTNGAPDGVYLTADRERAKEFATSEHAQNFLGGCQEYLAGFTTEALEWNPISNE